MSNKVKLIGNWRRFENTSKDAIYAAEQQRLQSLYKAEQDWQEEQKRRKKKED